MQFTHFQILNVRKVEHKYFLSACSIHGDPINTRLFVSHVCALGKQVEQAGGQVSEIQLFSPFRASCLFIHLFPPFLFSLLLFVCCS